MHTYRPGRNHTRDDYKRIWKTILRSCGIGTFIGVLPAEGATVASMIGYAEARRWSKNKEEFGKGSVEGIAGDRSNRPGFRRASSEFNGRRGRMRGSNCDYFIIGHNGFMRLISRGSR